MYTGYLSLSYRRAWGNIVGWGITVQAGRFAGFIPDEVIGFLNWPNPSSLTKALGPTHYGPEVDWTSNRNLRMGKGWQARKTDNLTAICELIV
jgi:hypothetical protein